MNTFEPLHAQILLGFILAGFFLVIRELIKDNEKDIVMWITGAIIFGFLGFGIGIIFMILFELAIFAFGG